MTNEVIWAIVITGKYAVWSSPREKRNNNRCPNACMPEVMVKIGLCVAATPREQFQPFIQILRAVTWEEREAG